MVSAITNNLSCNFSRYNKPTLNKTFTTLQTFTINTYLLVINNIKNNVLVCGQNSILRFMLRTIFLFYVTFLIYFLLLYIEAGELKIKLLTNRDEKDSESFYL